LLGSLGDTLVALPSLHLIARRFPQAERRVLTDLMASPKTTSMATLLQGTGLIHDYFQYPGEQRGAERLRDYWSVAQAIRRWRPHLLVYLHEQRGWRIALRDAAFFRLLGLTRIIGIPLSADLQRVGFDEATQRFEQRSEYLGRSLKELGDARLAERSSWDLSLSTLESAVARGKLAPLAECPGILAFSIGTKIEVNEWGDDNWRSLLARLGELLPAWGVVALGAPVERERSAAILCAASMPTLNLCGELSVRESGALMQACRVFVGHDSGPMHLAAAVGTRCVAIFSARNLPGRWFPYGAGHRVLYHKTECFGCGLRICTQHAKKCIASITVDEVCTAISASLQEAG
jgi:ADP-heptose:LPS heptosyltransferase